MNDAAVHHAAVDTAMTLTSESTIRTTDGGIALGNLHAQIAALEARTATDPANLPDRLALIDLLAVRGQTLDSRADAERAARLAEQVVQDAPAHGPAWLARARTRADDHRFAEALADLDVAERLGMDAVTVAVERVALLHALGRGDDALAVARAAVDRRPNFSSLAVLAVLHAERGEIAPAEALFAASLAHYRGVSPFPIAHLALLRGRMWQRAGDLPRARGWFAQAVGRVPVHAPARRALAELDAAPGAADDHGGC